MSLSKERLQRLTDRSTDMVVATDRAGKVDYYNDGAERGLGYRSREIMGEHVSRLYKNVAEAKRVMAAMRSPGDGGKGIVETIQHDPEEIAKWVTGLKKRFPRHRVLVALEQSRGAVISALAEHQELELFPINPRQLSSYRDSLFPSGAKSDPGDARLLADFLQQPVFPKK